MKARIAVFLLVSLLWFSHSAYSQGFPKGSYQQTCRGFDIVRYGSGYIFRAECQTTSKRWTDTSLDWNDVAKCDVDIKNVNGQLLCMASSPDAPAGSYRESCDHIVVAGSVVSARCVSDHGHWNPTMIDLTLVACPAGLVNSNGRLVCERTEKRGRGGAESRERL